nr:MAG: hypothetical protein OI719_00520 [Candidatus Methanoperedens sp.]
MGSEPIEVRKVIDLIAIKKNNRYFVRHRTNSYFDLERLIFNAEKAGSFDKHWLVFGLLPTRAQERIPGRQVITQYRLKDGFVPGQKTPSVLPLSAFEAVSGDEDEGIRNSDIRGLYEVEYETRPETFRDIEFTIEVIDEDCEPLVKPRYPYTTEFPHYIENHSTVRHKYPCYISPEELFAVVKAWIKKNLPEHCVISSDYNFQIQVDLLVPLLHDETHRVDVSGMHAKKPKYVDKPLRTVKYTVINLCTPGNKYGPVIEGIRAKDYYELEARIDGLLQGYADAMGARLVVCPHCKGYGFQSRGSGDVVVEDVKV